MTGLAGNYILVTPIYNEAPNLARLKETVLGQAKRPVLWVISDGNSADGSREKAIELFRDCGWVRVVSQRSFAVDGYSHKNFALNVNNALACAREICAAEGIGYDFVGKIDATPQPQPDYFDVLAEVLVRDPQLAFACGREHYQRDSLAVIDKALWRIPGTGINDQRLYRREFLEAAGDYPVSFAPDTILQIKARTMGMDFRVTDRTGYIEPRIGCTKIGRWKGEVLKGYMWYTLGYSPLLILLNTAYFLRFYPFYTGLGVAYGYLKARLSGAELIADEAVRDYFGKRRAREILGSLFWTK